MVSRLLREEHDDASCWSIKSGVVGPYAGRPADDEHFVGAAQEESHPENITDVARSQANDDPNTAADDTMTKTTGTTE